MAGMAWYLIKRAIDRFTLVLVVVILIFILIRVVPYYVYGEDPFIIYIYSNLPPGEIGAYAEIVEEFKKTFGIGEPFFPNQFVRYISALFSFNFGYSFIGRNWVLEEIKTPLVNTLMLNIVALITNLVIGFSVGWYSATKRGKTIESTIMGVSLWSYVTPAWLMAPVVLLVVGYLPRMLWGIHLFPWPPLTPPPLTLTNLPVYLWHLAMPAMAIVIAGFGGLVYYTRQLTISELGQDYVLTAKAKGVKETVIMRQHVFKNVMPPVVVMMAFALPSLIAGGIITETIFMYYGMGLKIWHALLQNDYPIVQTILFIFCLLTTISLYISDIVISWLDPRVRLR
ncbi:MAG: nickel transporter permease NikB [Candidatus Bathyarchaeota archaeon BA1]|nr:MAG: nickel transporter permease NikB [Candidatus Bathyarchaeota archaeon BA1]